MPQKSTTSVALLDKLSGRPSSTTSSDPALSVSGAIRSKSISEDRGVKTQASAHPVRKDERQTSDLKPDVHGHMKVPRQSSSAHSPSPPEPVVTTPVAPPSKFAKVLIGDSDFWKKKSTAASFQPYYTLHQGPTITNIKAFAGPSPDDIVIKAQNSKGHFCCIMNVGVIANVA